MFVVVVFAHSLSMQSSACIGDILKALTTHITIVFTYTITERGPILNISVFFSFFFLHNRSKRNCYFYRVYCTHVRCMFSGVLSNQSLYRYVASINLNNIRTDIVRIYIFTC
jgi:hypothetical protein